MKLRPLRLSFYDRDVIDVARDLLGRLLVRELDGKRMVGRVVEAEAYGHDDPASHAFRGPTRRNASMFGPPGHAYVYVSHGIHRCLNVVARPGSAVLIRAIEPLEGMEDMARRRGVTDVRLLCSGPGRLCSAMAIGLSDDGVDLVRGVGLWLSAGRRASDAVATVRVGVTAAADRSWRFVVPGSRFLSRPVPGLTRPPRG